MPIYNTDFYLVHLLAITLTILCLAPASLHACPFAARSLSTASSTSSSKLPRPQKVERLKQAAIRVSQYPDTWDTSNCDKQCLHQKCHSMVTENDGSEVPDLLRALFHDHQACALDGSLRYELDRPENFDLAGATEKVVSAAHHCRCSIADTYALSAKLALKVTGGPDVTMSWGHKDTTRPNPTGNMPDGRFDDPYVLRKVLHQYNDEAIALLSSAHNIGHFHLRNKDTVIKEIPFTTNEKQFSNEYFQNLVYLHDNKQPRENTFQLPSDKALINDPYFFYIVKAYASDDNLYRYHFRIAMELMIGDYTECNNYDAPISEPTYRR